jgi:tetratricopeptide (TPR) repeat protein
MGVDRKNLDPAAKATPPVVTRRATPPQLAAARPPPPPLRGKRTAAVNTTGGSAAVTAPARSLSPSPADMAFTRTLPVATTPVAPPVEPEPVALEPALVQPPPSEPAFAESASLPEAVASHPATTTDALAGFERPAIPRRLRTSTLISVAVGASLGLGAAAYFSRASTKATPTVAARPALPEPAALVPAREIDAQAPAAPPAPPLPATTPASGGEVARAEVAPQPSSAPSCQELLGSAYVEKRDPAAAFDQTQLGQHELVRGNVVGAQQAFCTAAQWDATNPERWLNLAQVFLLRRDGAKAADCARTALELQANRSRALTMLGDASAMLGKSAEARQFYLAAENRSEPDSAALRLMIRRDMEEAQRMVRRRDFARAERLFRRVMSFDAGHAEASAGLSRCLARLRNDP